MIVVNSLNRDPYTPAQSDTAEDFEFVDDLAPDQYEWMLRVNFPALSPPPPGIEPAPTHQPRAPPIRIEHGIETTTPRPSIEPAPTPVSDHCRRVTFDRLACRLHGMADYRVDWSDRVYLEMACSTVVMTSSAYDGDDQPGLKVNAAGEQGDDSAHYESIDGAGGGNIVLRLRSEGAPRRSRDDFNEIVKHASNILNSIPGITYFIWRT